MWTCPKCGRTFKRTNQDHYCGKAPETVEEYIASRLPETHAHLTALRALLLRCAPQAEERIAWSMPVYRKDRRSLSFAACKKHVSLYAQTDVLEIFKPQLSGYTIQKNAVYLPYDKELPLKVIEGIITETFGADSKTEP